jgi:CRISPR-associated endonuclease/helicase Cas3
MNHATLLAKSRKNGGTTLLDHTRHVMAAIEHFAKEWGFDQALAQKGAALHDLGKAHPKFQADLCEADGIKVWATDFEKRQWGFIHRHELSSLLLLPAFPPSDWDILIELVVAHHKPIVDEDKKRGLLSLVDEELIEGDTLDNHRKDWPEWAPKALSLLGQLGWPTNQIDEAETTKVWEYVVHYCEARKKRKAWSAWRGLLMAADHFASAMGHKTALYLPRTLKVPDLTVFAPTTPGGKLFPLADVPVRDPRPHTLVVAPTGAGKTNLLLRRCQGKRVFYTLPFQASINAMYVRISEALPNADVRFLHAAAAISFKQQDPAKFEEEYPLQGLVGAAVKVLTPHQLAALVFGLPGFEAIALDVRGQAVVLDEIHTYSDVSRSMVREIVKVLLRLGCGLHIGTATMPNAMYQELLDLLGGPEATYQVRLAREQLDSYDRHIVHKLPDWAQIDALLPEAFAQKQKVLLVCNTIGRAQELYKKMLKQFETLPNMLIHSRFKRGDRAAKEKSLREEFEGSSDQPGHRPCWVVATQVVEVSLDISFDLMITDCAPLDALIQRFGRINRRRTPEALGSLKSVYVIAPKGDQKPYNGETIRQTFAVLPDNAPLAEHQLQQMLDSVYALPPPEIAISEHLVWEGNQFKLGGLVNRKSSILLEALDIEAATCVLECDRATYEAAPWDERAMLEIPVSWSVLSRHAKQYLQLECGSRPYLIPLAQDEYDQTGLVFQEHDPFI